MFAPQPAVNAYSIPGVAASSIVVAKYTGVLPDPANMHVMVKSSSDDLGLIISTGSINFYKTAANTIYVNGIASVILGPGSPKTYGTSNNAQWGGLYLGNSTTAAARSSDAAFWSWCYLSVPISATQVAQIHAAFKAYFSNLGLP